MGAARRRDTDMKRVSPVSLVSPRHVLVALAIVSGMALALVAPLVTGQPGTTLFACGLGNTPTMLANSAPSLLYPITKDTPADVPTGIFALNYVAGQTVSFKEDLSRVAGAPAPDSFKWRWDFGDGSDFSYEMAPQHTYAAPGTYNVHAQIYDTSSDSGTWTDLDSAQISVVPAAIANPPVAKVTASVSAVVAGGAITFDAGGSHSTDGSGLTYLWNFNDGSTATGAHVTHTFAIQGQGIVALIVTDKRGARSVATTNILVAADSASSNATVTAPGASVTFNALKSGQSAGSPSAAYTQYVWNFGDGTPVVTTQTPTVTHAFAKPGTFVVTATGSSSQGNQGIASETFIVTETVVAYHTTTDSGNRWLLIAGGVIALLVLLVGGYLAVRAQRRRNALIRQRTAAMELARARTVAASKRGARPQQPAGRRGPPPEHLSRQPHQSGMSGRGAPSRQPSREQSREQSRPRGGPPTQERW